MAEQDANPRSIRVDLDTDRVFVAWVDGTASEFDGAFLRWQCPCAACRGHFPGEVEGPDREAVAGVRLTDAGSVGAYALRLSFSDGHDSGIYSFEHLRRIADVPRT